MKSKQCPYWHKRTWDDGYWYCLKVAWGKRTHRYTYEAFKGPIQPSHVIDHTCRNKHCCNPEHLRELTLQANSSDGANWYWSTVSQQTTGTQ